MSSHRVNSSMAKPTAVEMPARSERLTTACQFNLGFFRRSIFMS